MLNIYSRSRSSKPSTPHREGFSRYYASVWGGCLFRCIDIKKFEILSDIMSDLKDGARILDVGCGTGSLSGKLTDARSLRVFGLDMDVQLLCISRDNGLLPTAGSFDAAFPYVEETFDVVLMIDTIEHIQSRERTLCSVKRVLQSDGLFVVFTPRYDSLSWTIGESIFKVITRRAAHHITPFTVESLTWLFRNNFLEWRVGTTNFGLTLYAVGRYKI